jgi:hypothetical protein
VTLLTVVGAAAVGLTLAVGSKHASGAAVGTYLALGALALVVRWAPLPALDPLEALAPFWGPADPRQAPFQLLVTSLAWAAVAAVCFGLATLFLRHDARRQMQGAGRTRPAKAERRPPVDDDPIRWKENHIDGLAPLAMLRRVPRYWGVLLVGGGGGMATVVTAGRSIGAAAQWAGVNATPAVAPDLAPFLIQGQFFVFVATLIVTVRCAMAVSDERERLTWESLYLTGLDGETFIHGKLRGVIDAATPYLLAYAAPALAISVAAGPGPGVVTVISLVVAVPFLFYGASCGLYASTFYRSTWRSLLAALFAVYFTGLLICFVVTVGLGTCCVGLAGGIVGRELADLRESVRLIALVLSPLASLVILVVLGRSQLLRAAAHVFREPKEPQLDFPTLRRKWTPEE